MLLAVLDGAEVDSGTASELGLPRRWQDCYGIAHRCQKLRRFCRFADQSAVDALDRTQRRQTVQEALKK
jgi:hypothetical protein